SVVIAFSKERSVRMSRGFKSSQTISTIRLPQFVAIREWFESTAGIEDAPGSVRPRASAMAVIVDAVSMGIQCPADRAIPSSSSLHSQSLIFPAHFSAQYFQ